MKRQKILVLILLLTIAISIILPEVVLANNTEIEDEEPNFFIKILTAGARFINKFIYKKLDEESLSIDALVFNGDTSFAGLSLFKPGEVQDFIAVFYSVFLYIALVFLAPISLSAAYNFSKAGDNPQQKAMLLDKLYRILFTFVLLHAMPDVIAAIAKINNAFVNIIKSIFSVLMGSESNNIIGEYIINNKGAIDETVTGLMLIGINIWIIGFYIMRDLVVCFLFLFYPIIAIWHPMEKGMVGNWLREMASNIFSQPIQAVIFTIVVALGNNLGLVDNANKLSNKIYVFVAFASIIPLTSIVKRLLKLESGIGVGKSLAGFGAVAGLFRLTNMVSKTFKENGNFVKDNLRQLSSNKNVAMQSEKNISSVEDMSKPLINPRQSNQYNTQGNAQKGINDIERDNRALRRDTAKGIGSMVAGGYGSLVGAAMMAGVGPNEAIMGGTVGLGIGRSMGNSITDKVYAGGSAIKHRNDTKSAIDNLSKEMMVEDYNKNYNTDYSVDNFQQFEEDYINDIVRDYSIDTNDPKEMKKARNLYNEARDDYRNKATDKYYNLDNPILEGTEFKEKELQALKKKEMWRNMGVGSFSNNMSARSYVKEAPYRMSADEMKEVENPRLYQDQDVSIIYSENSDKGIEILSISEGNPYFSGNPIDEYITFDGNNEDVIPQHKMEMIGLTAKAEAIQYAMNYHGDAIGTKEYEKAYTDRLNYVKRQLIDSENKKLQSIRKSTNIDNLNFKNISINNLEPNKESIQSNEIREKLSMQQKEHDEVMSRISELRSRVYQEDFKQSIG